MAKLSDENRLSIKFPELVKEWDFEKNFPLVPENFTIKSNKSVWWKCKNGHSWKTSVGARTNGHNCPYCSGRFVTDKNKLITLYPELCKEWNYEKNLDYPIEKACYGSHKMVWWKCEKGHEWKAEIKARVHGNGCPFCDNKKVDANNCFAKIHPELVEEWHNEKNGELTPFDVPSSSKRKVWWKCNFGHEWFADIDHRHQGRGCPFCNKIILSDGTYFDSLLEAYVYLRLKGKGFEVQLRKKYGIKRYVGDFYLPQINTYLEVTSFDEKSFKYDKSVWLKYSEKIIEKKKYVEDVLKGNFRFIQIRLNNKQIMFVRKNMSRAERSRC